MARESEVRKRESQMTEDVVLEPGGAIANGEDAADGFATKANFLSVLVFEREARVMTAYPELAEVVLKSPETPRERLKAFEQLKASDPRLSAAVDTLLQPLRSLLDAPFLLHSPLDAPLLLHSPLVVPLQLL